MTNRKRRKVRFFIHEQEGEYTIHFGTDIYKVSRVKCNAHTEGLFIKYGHAKSIKLIDKKKGRVAVIYK